MPNLHQPGLVVRQKAVGRMPRRYRGKDIFIWFEQSGLFDVPRQMEPSGRIEPRPLVGAVHTISLQLLSAQGVLLLGRFTGAEAPDR
jgi:putative flavoprotein involved in K+ transport